jgi:PAS domain S-box-containing protein
LPLLGEIMEKKNILIVDDDPNLRRILTDILKMRGYEAFAAATGAEGMERLGSSPVNLAVIDLGLPDMSGLDVLTSVRANSSDTEAIVLTGNSSVNAAIEATNRGAFSYLLKPCDMEQLLLHVQRALEKQEIAETLRKSEARYRMLAENARDLIWTLDCSRRVTYISPSVECLRGFTPEEAIRHDTSDAITPASEKTAKADMEEIFQSGAKGEKRETRVHEIEFIRKGGGTIWLEVSSSGLYDPSGEFLGILCSGRDISERKKAEAEKNLLIAELQEALAKIKTLSGLLPICSVCKKIRDDHGKWEELEVYIRDHSQADFSHGICSDCLGRIYPPMENED